MGQPLPWATTGVPVPPLPEDREKVRDLEARGAGVLGVWAVRPSGAPARWLMCEVEGTGSDRGAVVGRP